MASFIINPFTGDLIPSTPGPAGPSGATGSISGAPAGSAAAPSITFTGDTNTGIYSPGADQIAISTGGFSRLFVDTGGRVGINKTPGVGAGFSQRLQIKQTGDTYDGLQVEKFDDDSFLGVGVYNSVWSFVATYNTTGSYLPVRFYTGASERLRIRADGTFEIKGAGTAGVSPGFSVNPSTPANSFVIDSSGRLLVGTSSDFDGYLNQVSSTSGTLLSLRRTNSNPGSIKLSSGASGDNVGSGTNLGYLRWYGFHTSADYEAARISAEVDNTPGANDMPGRLVFSTTADGAASPTERMRIDNAGRVLVGTSTANTSGAKLQTSDGLTFPATQVASSDPNTLDDYEEGTWTPSVTNMTTTGSPAYGGRYRKIGSQVTIWFFTTTAGGVATYAATSNSTSVAGLPFTSGYDGAAASGGPPGCAVNGNTTAGGFVQGPASGSATFFFDTTIAATQGISVSLTYYV
jgi:hypothetical protein